MLDPLTNCGADQLFLIGEQTVDCEKVVGFDVAVDNVLSHDAILADSGSFVVGISHGYLAATFFALSTFFTLFVILDPVVVPQAFFP